VRELDGVAVGRALDLDAKGLRRTCDDVQEAERRDVRVAIDAIDMSVGRHGPPYPIRAMVSSGAERPNLGTPLSRSQMANVREGVTAG